MLTVAAPPCARTWLVRRLSNYRRILRLDGLTLNRDSRTFSEHSEMSSAIPLIASVLQCKVHVKEHVQRRDARLG